MYKKSNDCMISHLSEITDPLERLRAGGWGGGLYMERVKWKPALMGEIQ